MNREAANHSWLIILLFKSTNDCPRCLRRLCSTFDQCLVPWTTVQCFWPMCSALDHLTTVSLYSLNAKGVNIQFLLLWFGGYSSTVVEPMSLYQIFEWTGVRLLSGAGLFILSSTRFLFFLSFQQCILLKAPRGGASFLILPKKWWNKLHLNITVK